MTTQPLKFHKFIATVHNVTRKIDAYSNGFNLASAMVVAHESKGGTYWEQQGGGPALGIIQMEPWVHDDVWKHSDNIHKWAKKLGYIENVDLLRTSITYNILMMRSRFAMDTNPFPNDMLSMAEYLNNFWNGGDLGKATPEKYLNDFGWWVTYEHDSKLS